MTRRRAPRLVAAAVAALASAGLVGLAAIPSQAVPAADAPAQVATLAPGQSIATLTDAVTARAKAVLGSRFVDLWVAPDQQSFEVGVYGLKASEKARLTVRIATAGPVELVARAISRAQVDTLVNKAEAAAKRAGATGTTVAPDYTTGDVVVSAPSSAAVKRVSAQVNRLTTAPVATGDEARYLAGSGAGVTTVDQPTIAIDQSGQVRPFDAETQASLPYRGGGKAIFAAMTSDSANMCTSGFLVQKAGVTYGLTAGHCAPNGKSEYLGDLRVDQNVADAHALGAVSASGYWYTSSVTADAEIFPVPAAVSPSATVFLGAGQNRAVAGSATPVAGLNVCTRGSTTQEEVCGQIQRTGVSVEFQPESTSEGGDGMSHNLTDMIRFQASDGTAGIAQGDSGSPLYVVQADGTALAVGTATGGNRSVSYWTPLQDSLEETGTTLVTGQTTSPTAAPTSSEPTTSEPTSSSASTTPPVVSPSSTAPSQSPSSSAPTQPPSSSPASTTTVPAAVLNLRPSSWNASAGSDSTDFIIYSTQTIRVQNAPTWLSLFAVGRYSRDATLVEVFAQPNTGAARSATMTFTAGGASGTFTVSQAAGSSGHNWWNNWPRW
ncbi:MAG: trypsin-like serine protease [Bifidobacteriaceae bacterium]|jgi:hypothetical protein|nr:trypsin-like serine protease [Bifidobacteriaceae bacterium]